MKKDILCGWYDFNNNRYIPTDFFEHFSMLSDEENRKQYPAAYNIFRNMKTTVENEYSDFWNSLDEHSHPEWHLYEIWKDEYEHDEKRKIIKIMNETYATFRICQYDDILELQFDVPLSDLEKSKFFNFAKSHGLQHVYRG